MSFNFTDEQRKIIETEYKKGQSVCIKAFAGTGKTFTLTHLADKIHERDPSLRIIYLAFNKSVADEAKSKFKPFVDCKTTHSIAFCIGADYRHKLGYNKLGTLLSALPISVTAKRSKWEVVRALKGMVDQFMYSAFRSVDEFVSEQSELLDQIGADATDTQYTALKYVKHVWLQMTDVTNSTIKLPHDGYLKLYQMSNPDLSKNYDVILFDECQDANPVTLDIVEQQRACLRVYVGDDHQQIYQFRNSVNAFESLKDSDFIFRLSNSFRFGPNIAGISNHILSKYKDEKVPLVGVSIIPGDVGAVDERDKGELKGYAVVSRTNAYLFEVAVSTHEKGNSFGFVGGAQGYKELFDNLLDTYNLSRGSMDKIIQPIFKKYGSFAGYKDYASNSEDREALTNISFVDKYGDSLPALVELIRTRGVHWEKADVVLTTVHKSKGLEFNNVYIPANYLREEKDNPGILVLTGDEINMLYVAVTRAIERLVLEKSVITELKRAARADTFGG